VPEPAEPPALAESAVVESVDEQASANVEKAAR
jgi:hypothetical protein